MTWDSGKLKKPKSLTDFMKYIEKSKASSPKCQKCAYDLSTDRVRLEVSYVILILFAHSNFQTHCPSCGKFFCGGCALKECANVVPKAYFGVTDPAARATPVPVCVACYGDISHKQ